MDLSLVFTIIGTGAAVVGANIALISWVRSDMAQIKSEIRSDIKSFEGEIRGWKDEIYKEMKDFHGRLCYLQSKTKTDP